MKMRLRKSYVVKQGKKKYNYVSCPDTDADRNTTKLIHQCKECDDYHGLLNDISGKYIRCSYFKPRALIDKEKEFEIEESRFYVNKRLMWALDYFSIHPNEFEGGLKHVKDLAKKSYREKLFKYHPDTTKLKPDKANKKLRKLRNMLDKIDDLKLTPPTEDTLDTYLELHGEYNTEMNI